MQKLSTTLIAVLALACAAAEPVFADDRQDIEEAVTRFEQAVNAGDAAAIAAMYTEDAALMPPGAPIVQGRDKVGEFWKSMLGMGMTNFDIMPTEVMVAGNNAVEVGTFSYGEDVKGTGKYITLWQKADDGTWRVRRDIWNEDMRQE